MEKTNTGAKKLINAKETFILGHTYFFFHLKKLWKQEKRIYAHGRMRNPCKKSRKNAERIGSQIITKK